MPWARMKKAATLTLLITAQANPEAVTRVQKFKINFQLLGSFLKKMEKTSNCLEVFFALKNVYFLLVIVRPHIFLLSFGDESSIHFLLYDCS